MCKLIKLFFIIVFAIMLFSSCVQQKNVAYFNQEFNDTIILENLEYRINNGDVLGIDISGINSSETSWFNSGTAYNRYQNQASIATNGFRVDDNGYISLPYLGKHKVINLTISEVEDSVQKSLYKYVKDGYVKVNLLNFRVNILGEVDRPGSYTFFNTDVTIFEALSSAGDITKYGNKREVILLRNIDNSKVKKYHIDLTAHDFIYTDSYYMNPGDVIYVGPIKGRYFRDNLPIYSFVISSVTALILIMNYIQL